MGFCSMLLPIKQNCYFFERRKQCLCSCRASSKKVAIFFSICIRKLFVLGVKPKLRKSQYHRIYLQLRRTIKNEWHSHFREADKLSWTLRRKKNPSNSTFWKWKSPNSWCRCFLIFVERQNFFKRTFCSIWKMSSGLCLCVINLYRVSRYISITYQAARSTERRYNGWRKSVHYSVLSHGFFQS